MKISYPRSLLLSASGIAIIAVLALHRSPPSSEPNGSRNSGERKISPNVGAAENINVNKGGASSDGLFLPSQSSNFRAWLTSKMRNEWKDWDANPQIAAAIANAIDNLDKNSAEEALKILALLSVEFRSGNNETRNLIRSNDFCGIYIKKVMIRLIALDPTRAFELADSANADRETLTLATDAAVANGVTALESKVGDPTDKRFRTKIGAIVESVAKIDPQRAANLLNKYPGPLLDSERERFIDILAANDPKSASTLVGSMVVASGSSNIMRVLLDRWMESNPLEATEWAKAYSGPGKVDVETYLLTTRLADYKLSDSLTQFNQLLNRGASSASLSPAAAQLALRIAAESPQSASDWAMQLPNGIVKEKAVEAVVRNWLKSDSLQASQWADTLPAGKEREKAARLIVEATMRSDPASAYAWASSLANPQERNLMKEAVFDHWILQNPEAAKAMRETEEAKKSNK